MEQKFANPGPLGLAGFGMTTILLNIHNAGFYPLSAMIMAMGIFYGGISQVIAGLLEQKRGNTFGTLAFISYGFFWISLVATWILPKLGFAEATPASYMGWYLAVWGVFSIFMTIGTLKSSKVLIFVFVTLDILFVLLALHNWTGSALIGKIAGWEGIVCGSAALYLGMAEMIEERWGRKLLPF
ncbi:MAG: acetate uptake transporter [Spirochaetes bacterium]|nr:acetate uptake transporter [Spirochaetota bacterium]MBU0956002.1 acetate uptake transporter [Spirochaetota bacterium]